MTRVLGIAAGAALILLFASLLLIVMPSIQLQSRHNPAENLERYSEAAQRGRETYVSLGCHYCHSQQPRAPGQAPDAQRGWGRPSVPGDYSYDEPHLLGTMRTGPDLFNIGARQPSADWHLAHLYNPRALVPDSTMPSFPFLFRRALIVVEGDREVSLPPEYGPDHGHIIATQRALDLVQYLLELDRTYSVKELARADKGSSS